MTKFVFRLQEAPRYLRDKEELQVADNLLWQSAFWNTMRSLIDGADDRTGSVEMRMASKGPGELAIWVIVDLPEPDASAEETLRKLLPRDYEWRAEPFDVFKDAFEQDFHSPSGWSVARLWRRVELVTLPNVQPWMRSSTIEDAGSDAPPEPDLDGGYRRLPLPHIPLRSQLTSDVLCAPIIGEVRSDTADRWRFLQDMLDFGRTVVSIAVHPAPKSAIEDDRGVATYLHRALESINGPAVLEGIVSREDVARTYLRYWGAYHSLCFTTIRVASESATASVALAHNLAVRLGDTRAFEVRPPRRTIPSVLGLGDIGWDVPTEDAMHSQPEAWEGFLKNWLEALGVDATGVGEPNTDFPESFLLRLPHLYTMSEAENIIKLPFAFDEGLPGLEVRPLPPFYPPAIRSPAIVETAVEDSARIRLGLHRQGAMQRWHTIDKNDLSRHLFLTGTTGSGKSVLCQSLLCELDRVGIPFLVVEPVKTEYFDALKGKVPKLQRFRFESIASKPTPDFVWFDPMRLLGYVTVSRHISHLMACFRAAFPMDALFEMVLEGGLRSYYCSPREEGGCGLSLLATGGVTSLHRDREKRIVSPSFAHFTSFFLGKYLKREFAAPGDGTAGRRSGELLTRLWEFEQAFERRFRALSEGPLGISFRIADALALQSDRGFSPLSSWLKRPTIIELDGLTDPAQKSLFMSLLLAFIFEARQVDDRVRRRSGDDSATDTRHVLVLDEAHRILERKASAPSVRGDGMTMNTDVATGMFIDMLAEIRAYGQGLMLVEQIPTKIVPEAIKNTSTKMMMCLPSADDREYMGTAMNCNSVQQDYVATLRTGEVAVYEKNLDRPVLLNVPAATK